MDSIIRPNVITDFRSGCVHVFVSNMQTERENESKRGGRERESE